MTDRALPLIALLPLVAGSAAAQTTSVPRPGPGFTSGPATRLVPAWGFRAYVNEDFALKPTDPGQCEPAPDLGLVVCGVKTGEVIALTMSGGEPAWVFRTRGGVRARPVIADGALYVGSSDGCLYRLDPRTGKTTWKAPFCTDAAVHGSPAVAGGLVYFPVTVNKLYAVSEGTGQFAWEHHRDRPRFMSAEGVASPVVEGDRVYVGYSDGALVALDRANGKVARGRPSSAATCARRTWTPPR
ncbi:MAG: PQQ-like beta-propeller repeat protein [Deltaproteobacteria bacterium]|nr:PQQ-like beta-propeller repeat protein [Deltaproteobacteria bacterium]